MGRGRPPAAAKGGTPLFWFLREYVFLLFYLALALFGMVFDLLLKKRRPDPGRPAIVILHGLFSTPVHWLPLEFRLRRAGFSNIIRPAYQRGSAVEQWVARLADELRKHEGGIVFVAHSIGGLVATMTAERLPKGAVRGIITCGAPFGGSLMARFAFSRAGRQLLPENGLVRESVAAAKRSDLPFTCLWSKFDQLVLPAESATLPGAVNIEMEGLGHTGYHFSHAVTEQIVAALKRTVS